MPQKTTDNLRIQGLRTLAPSGLLREEIPITDNAANTIRQARNDIQQILRHENDKLVVVVGPCSIHDIDAAMEYAEKLKQAKKDYGDKLCLIMRVYFEKPRTTIGWKGLINDPDLDSSFNINKGLHMARRLLLDINEMGVPTGSEFLDTIIPQYISDLTSWSAIGARTTESQIHRELASGLSMPVGFKNGTTGNMQIAVDAVMAAKHPHQFLGVSKDGVAAIVSTMGNSSCHIILRGSADGPNYEKKYVDMAIAKLNKAELYPRVMIDCSHGNSQKDHNKQILVAQDVAAQIKKNPHSIMGVMIESHLVEGKQSYHPEKALVYGKSITDACVDWSETVRIFDILAGA